MGKMRTCFFGPSSTLHKQHSFNFLRMIFGQSEIKIKMDAKRHFNNFIFPFLSISGPLKRQMFNWSKNGRKKKKRT